MTDQPQDNARNKLTALEELPPPATLYYHGFYESRSRKPKRKTKRGVIDTGYLQFNERRIRGSIAVHALCLCALIIASLLGIIGKTPVYIGMVGVMVSYSLIPAFAIIRMEQSEKPKRKSKDTTP